MTVINTNYSNIEEVWGSPFEKPKKKKSKQNVDPLWIYMVNDIINC